MAKNTIAIGYVHPGKVDAYFMSSVVRLLRTEGHRIEEVISIHSGPKIDDARNQLFTEWLTNTNANRFLMVDTDMMLPSDTITKLLGHNKDIVGGLCFSMGGNGIVKPVLHVVKADGEGKPTIDLLWDYPPNRLVQVDATGGACMMVTRRCAETIWQARGKDHPLPWFAHGVHNGVQIGEDVAFCLTAGKLGFKVFVDTGLEIPHIKSFPLGSADYVRSLGDERHPRYNQRNEVPRYQELMNGDASLDGDKQSLEEVPSIRHS